MSFFAGFVLRGSVGHSSLPTATAGSVDVRRLSRTFGLAALLVLAVGAWAEPAVAVAIDDTYYQWCTEALGQKAYCCNKAGGVWTGSNCTDAVSTPAPSLAPPNNGILFP